MKTSVKTGLLVLGLGLSAVLQAAVGDPKDSGKWQLIAKDAFGQKTFMDTAHFEAGFPAQFLVKTDIVQCVSKYRMNTCTKVALFEADCKQGKLKYVRDMTRDVTGGVVKEWENHRAKMVYPPSGTTLETLLIRACQRNKKLI